MSEYVSFGLGSKIITNEAGHPLSISHDTNAATTLHQQAITLCALVIVLDGGAQSWEDIKTDPLIQNVPYARGGRGRAGTFGKEQILPSPTDSVNINGTQVPNKVASGPLHVESVKQLALRLPAYISLKGPKMNPTISIRNMGVGVTYQTRQQANETYLRYAQKEKIHLFDYDHLDIACGENHYALSLGTTTDLAEQQTAIIAARLLLMLREKARLTPKSPFVGRDRAAKMLWDNLPPRERVLFDAPPSGQLVYDVFRSGLGSLQHHDGETHEDIIVSRDGALGLNIPVESLRFKLVAQPFRGELGEVSHHYRPADRSVSPEIYEHISDDHLDQLITIGQLVLNDQRPNGQQQAILMLDLLMNLGWRRAVEQKLSIRLSTDQIEASHRRIKSILGWAGYDTAVSARTIKSRRHYGTDRVTQKSAALDASKVLKFSVPKK